MRNASKARAQAYVEYGLLVAVVVIGFLVGLNALMGAATAYMAHAEPTPNATVLANLPNHVVEIKTSCTPLSAPVVTGQPINCSLTVTDITTIEPGRLPTGTIVFTSGASGTFSSCNLGGSGVISGCSFQYTPTNFGPQDLAATYIPSSSHQSRTEPPPPLPGQYIANAVDQTDTRLSCATTVLVGEPSQCNVEVVDLYPARFGTVPGLSVDVTASGGGTLSGVNALTPRYSTSYPSCPTSLTLDDGTSACGTLFRSGATPADANQSHTIAAAYAGDPARYFQSDTSNAPPMVVNVGGPPQHPVTVDVQCDAGAQSSPLQINVRNTTNCRATVTDTNPASTGNPRTVQNPTGITPTGRVSWSATQDSGGAGSLPNTCGLSETTAGAAACTITYTATSVGMPPGPGYVGTHQVVATYLTDWIHTQQTTSPSTEGLVYVKDQHPVQLDVSCTPGQDSALPLLIQGASADTTTCRVNVTDNSSTGTPVTPTGSVSWGLSTNGGTGAGGFMGSTCQQLQRVDSATAQCQITYQPRTRGTPDMPGQVSTHLLTAYYQGDWLHPLVVQRSLPVFVGYFHPVQVTVNCSATTRAAPLRVGPPPTSAACRVNVLDASTSEPLVTPTGTVSWGMSSDGANGDGSFTPSGPCQLQPAGPGAAQCSAPVTYQPTARGMPDGLGPDTDNTHYVIATYSGDGLHPPRNNDQIGTSGPIYVND